MQMTKTMTIESSREQAECLDLDKRHPETEVNADGKTFKYCKGYDRFNNA